jgi:hypothetical protein
MNQLQALAMNEGKRWKSKLSSPQGRAELDKLVLAFCAGRHRRELLELLDRLNPRDVRLSCITGTPMPHATSASSCRGCRRSFQWQISVLHLLQRHRPRSLSLEQTLGSTPTGGTKKMGVASQSHRYTKVFRLGPFWGRLAPGSPVCDSN